MPYQKCTNMSENCEIFLLLSDSNMLNEYKHYFSRLATYLLNVYSNSQSHYKAAEKYICYEYNIKSIHKISEILKNVQFLFLRSRKRKN